MAQKFVFVNVDGDYQETPGAYEQTDFINVTAGVADAGKPIVLDATGYLDGSFIDASDIDHGELDPTSLTHDDHTIYILADGSRAFSGPQAMAGFLITGLGAPANAGDATNKAYVDALATGLRPHSNVRVGTLINVNIASAPAVIDGVTLSSGDRVLVKNQTTATENGIYDYNGSGSAMTRSDDFDNSPLGEIWNGSFIPMIMEGTQVDTPWVVTSIGTGTDELHTIGTDDIDWDQFTSPTQLSDGDGIDITTNVISVDLLDADSGLAFLGAGTDELGIQWATTFTIDAADDLALKASDLASTTTNEGAAVVGIEDSVGNFTADNVEDALAELAASTSGDYNIYTAGGSITLGDLVYVSANDTVTLMPITAGHVAIGVAGNTTTVGNNVQVMKDDAILAGILSGATAGTKYYWNGSGWQTTMSGVAGRYIWLGGVAKNATDVQVETRFIKRNSL